MMARTETHESETLMANHSRWEDVKARRPEPTTETRASVERDLALGIYDLPTGAGLSQAALAKRMATTQSVISRLEEGSGARNRIDTLARVAKALNRHLVVPSPNTSPPTSPTQSSSPDQGKVRNA
jgi:ribosome-binding protein aMBF1 (putative translation factor)